MAGKKVVFIGICEEANLFLTNLTSLLKSQEILTSLDEDTLNLIGNTYHNYIEATKLLHRDGMLIESPRGELKAHPCVKIQLDAQIQLNKMMDSFGLSPKARKELSKPKERSEALTPIDVFLESTKKKK